MNITRFQNNNYTYKTSSINPSFKKSGIKLQISKETLQELLKTMTVKEIAQKYNVSVYPIYDKMRQNELKKRATFSLPKLELHNLLKENKSIREIAEMYNQKVNIVRSRINRLGLGVKKPKEENLVIRRSQKERLEIIKQKISIEEAAKILNISEKEVAKIRVYMRKQARALNR